MVTKSNPTSWPVIPNTIKLAHISRTNEFHATTWRRNPRGAQNVLQVCRSWSALHAHNTMGSSCCCSQNVLQVCRSWATLHARLPNPIRHSWSILVAHISMANKFHATTQHTNPRGAQSPHNTRGSSCRHSQNVLQACRSWAALHARLPSPIKHN